MPGDADHNTLERIVRASPVLSAILRDWPAIGLPDGWLVAGAVAQTVWNNAFGFPAHHGLKDADIIYFDRSDLTEATEEHHAERIRRLFAHLAMAIDVKNEARVHLWYEAKFGKPIAPYRSAAHAITTFPTTATSIGIRPLSSGLAIEAPYRSPRPGGSAEQNPDHARRLRSENRPMAAVLAGPADLSLGDGITPGH